MLAADIARRAGHDDEAVRLAGLAQKRWPQSNAAIDMHTRIWVFGRPTRTSRNTLDSLAIVMKLLERGVRDGA